MLCQCAKRSMQGEWESFPTKFASLSRGSATMSIEYAYMSTKCPSWSIIPSIHFHLWHKWRRLVQFLRTPLVICSCHLTCSRLCHATKLIRQCLWHLILGLCALGCILLHLLLGTFLNVFPYSEHSMCMCIEHDCARCSLERLNTKNIFCLFLPHAPTLWIFYLLPPWVWELSIS